MHEEFIAREIVDILTWMFADGVTLKGLHGRIVGVNPEWLTVYGMPVVGDFWLVDRTGKVSLCRREQFLANYEHVAGWRYRKVRHPG